MSYITKNEIKKHLNLDEWFEDDDNYLLSLIQIAEDATEKRINRPLDTCLKNDGELESSVKHLILIIAATMYNQREAVTPLNVKEVPFTLSFLADLNKKYTVG